MWSVGLPRRGLVAEKFAKNPWGVGLFQEGLI